MADLLDCHFELDNFLDVGLVSLFALSCLFILSWQQGSTVSYSVSFFFFYFAGEFGFIFFS